MTSRSRAFSKLAKDIDVSGNITAEGIAPTVDLGGGTTVYATLDQLPRSGNTSGDTAFVTATSRFYIWNGVGWFNVAVVNAAPTITNAPNATYNLFANGSPTIITLAATDSDGDTLTWSYDAPDASGKATITQANNVFTITPLTDIADTSFTIDFEVTDGINVATASSTVNIDNRAPSITTSPAATYALATDGSPTVITLAATDPDGGSITWTYVDSGLTDQATIAQSGNEFTITPNSTPAAYADFTLTFTASDSIESTSTSPTTLSLTFSLVADQWSDLVLGINTSSTNNLDNQTFIDRSTNAWGSAVNTWGTSFYQTAFHPYLDNWSVEFDGAGDYLSVNSTAAVGSGDYTMELWINGSDVETGTWQSLLSRDYANSDGFRLYKKNGVSELAFYSGGTSVRATTVSAGLKNNTWHHIAVVRNSGTLDIYVDGVSKVSVSNSDNISEAVKPINIGGNTGEISSYPYEGYISGARIVVGTAVYTSNFTPPTEKLTAVSGTSLLTCQSNRFIDNSSNAHTITIGGDSKVSAYNPFGQGSEYNVGANTGSVSFTTTDGIDLKVRSSGTASTWTIEFWYKIDPTSSINANHYLFDARGTAGSQTAGSLYLYRTNTATYNDGSNWGITDANFNDGAWHWFTMVSDGTNRAIWIDGTRIAELGGTRTVGTHLWINSRNTNQYHNDCEFSDFRFSSTARYATSSTTISVPTSPVGTDGNTTAYYPFDNAGVFDKTGNNRIDLTTTGLSSTSITKYSNSSLRLSGSGYVTAELPFEFGLVDFTIEWWQRTDNNTNDSLVTLGISTANGGQETGWHFGFTPTTYRFWSGASYSFTGGSVTPATFTGGVWNHIAICRENGVYYGYINGNYFGSLSGLSSISLTASDIKIGGYISSSSSFSRYPPGNVENLQLLLGRKYTTNFTPPTQEQGRTYQAES